MLGVEVALRVDMLVQEGSTSASPIAHYRSRLSTVV